MQFFIQIFDVAVNLRIIDSRGTKPDQLFAVYHCFVHLSEIIQIAENV